MISGSAYAQAAPTISDPSKVRLAWSHDPTWTPNVFIEYRYDPSTNPATPTPWVRAVTTIANSVDSMALSTALANGPHVVVIHSCYDVLPFVCSSDTTLGFNIDRTAINAPAKPGAISIQINITVP